MTMKPMIGAREAAAFLGLSVRQVWTMAKAGHLPAIRSGSSVARTPWMFHPDDLWSYKNNNAALTSIAVAAKQAGAPINTVYFWVNNGTLNAKKVHGVMSVNPADVRRLFGRKL